MTHTSGFFSWGRTPLDGSSLNGKSHHSARFVPLLLRCVINLALFKEDLFQKSRLARQVLVRHPCSERRTICRCRFQYFSEPSPRARRNSERIFDKIKIGGGRRYANKNGSNARPLRTLGDQLAPLPGLKRTFTTENPADIGAPAKPGPGAGLRPHIKIPLDAY